MKCFRVPALFAMAALVSATLSPPVDASASLRMGYRCTRADNDKCNVCFDTCKNGYQSCDLIMRIYKTTTCRGAVETCNNLCMAAPCCS
jgi:hypothetical protein